MRRVAHARYGLAVAAAAAALAALPTAPAGAQSQRPAKPAPGCGGLAFRDPTGDAISDYTGLGVRAKGPASADITGGFFRWDGRRVTANIQIADLEPAHGGIGGQTAADGLMETDYTLFYTFGGKTRTVTAARSGRAFAFHFGTYDDQSGVLTTNGDTTGRAFEGKDGVVQIDVPPSVGGAADRLLSDPYAKVSDRFAMLVSPDDTAPDRGRGANYFVGGCVDREAVTPLAARLPLRAPVVIGSASAANARHRLVFNVRSTRTITDLRLVLRRADGRGNAFAAGTVQRLRGTRTVVLRVLRQLRPATYLLVARGRVGAKRLKTSQQVHVQA